MYLLVRNGSLSDYTMYTNYVRHYSVHLGISVVVSDICKIFRVPAPLTLRKARKRENEWEVLPSTGHYHEATAESYRGFQDRKLPI